MTLDPGRYECPTHHTNLTAQVEEALGDNCPPVAYRRRPFLGKRAPAARPFQVVVSCPGGDNAGPHPLTCTGTWTP